MSGGLPMRWVVIVLWLLAAALAALAVALA
jgi:hypothetical protein